LVFGGLVFINKSIFFGSLDNKFVKFLIVGFINTVFGYSVFALFVFFNFHYTIASLLSTILGVLFNFKTIGQLVFNNNNNNLLIKFIGVYTVSYSLNVAFLRIFNIFNINMFIAGAVLVLPMAVISFTLNQKFVFKEKNFDTN